MIWFLRKKERKYLLISTAIFFAVWALFYFGIGSLFSGSLESGSMEQLYEGESFFSLFANNLLHCAVCAAGFGILSVPMLVFDAGSIAVVGVAFRFSAAVSGSTSGCCSPTVFLKFRHCSFPAHAA